MPVSISATFNTDNKTKEDKEKDKIDVELKFAEVTDVKQNESIEEEEDEKTNDDEEEEEEEDEVVAPKKRLGQSLGQSLPTTVNSAVPSPLVILCEVMFSRSN